MKLLATIIVVLSLQGLGFSQAKTEIDRGIIVKEKGADKAILVKENKRIKIWLRGEDEAITGRYSVINDSIIQIDSIQYAVGSIAIVRAPRSAIRVVGGVLAGTGVIVMGLGISAIAISLTSNDGLEQLLGLLGGGILTIMGIVPTAIGIPLMYTGKKYKEEEWELSIQS